MRKCAAILVLMAFLVVPGLARADTFLLADLNGENEVPPADTPGYGFVVLYLPDDFSYLYYYIEFSDLVGSATRSHIHAGPAGRAGPQLFTLSGVPRAAAGWFEGYLTPAQFSPGGGIASYEEAILAMFAGEVYINIHSSRYSGGEIRGQTYLYEKP